MIQVIQAKSAEALKEYIVMRKITTKEVPSILASEDPANGDRLRFDLVEGTLSEISFYGSLILCQPHTAEHQPTAQVETLREKIIGNLIRTKPAGVLLGGISVGAASIDTIIVQN